jgi:myo-inositol-1(or 4)-monophosphatase
MDHGQISSIVEVGVVSARLAGQWALEQQRYIKAEIKNESELVTNADRECQKKIIERIKESFPDHGFIGEEGLDGSILKQEPRGDDDIWWIIDPIDGTNNFAKGMMTFAVSVGVIYNGEPLAGVIFEPATDSMFTAAKDMEATLNSSRIHVSEDELGRYSNFAMDANVESGNFEKLLGVMKAARFRNLGSTALHLAYVAKGGLAGMVTNSPRIWDVAAGTLIIEAAGGKVTDLKGERLFPVEPRGYEGQKYEMTASNGKVHEQLLEMLGQ